MKNKKGAFELSMTVVVIIVIAMTLLILGMVLVRRIMCGAMGLTTDISGKVREEINDIFQDEGAEVACIGSGTEAVAVEPGVENIFSCGINPQKEALYEIKDITIETSDSSVEKDINQNWVNTKGWKDTLAPGPSDPIKYLRMNIPSTAPEVNFYISLKVYRDGTLIATKTLDFVVRRTGWFRSTMC